ncbi:BA75_00253T0 [Komagataella pastoris]|uniref:DNA topoisomerase I n=1 Tax=Komagataella pastoris TaxID=4922 RepID=A0A1B2J5X6_PICPA|nr:BA75_00253T0 [Komagataella pastoris]
MDIEKRRSTAALSESHDGFPVTESRSNTGDTSMKDEGTLGSPSLPVSPIKTTSHKRKTSDDFEKKKKKKKTDKHKHKHKNGTKKENGNDLATVKNSKEKKKRVKKEETPLDSQTIEMKDEEEEKYRWWEENNDNDEIKWHSLKHNGVLFPPEHVPLPSHVKLYYDKKPVDLPIQAEEVACFFGAMLNTEHAQNPAFQNNFFSDFKKIVLEHGGANVEIENFDNCDFSKIFEHYESQKTIKKSLTAAQKREIKSEKDKFEEKYKYCLLNGRRERVGNFRIEPPGLFRGRGSHPKTGRVKKRIYPEDVSLNLSEDAPIPPPPEGHQWKEIKHDNTVAWLATWRENVTNTVKYVLFAADSSLKGRSDFKKFEKARELKNYIHRIRKDYKKNFSSKVMLERQMAVATYLIDVFALRAGGEKAEDEADTVGCCSLRYEHVTLKPPNTVVFDFLGKDSIRYYQEVNVHEKVFKNLRLFKKSPKQPGDDLFDRLTPNILNKHLQNYLPGLSAKVFRTYNASKTMQDQLDLIPNEGTVGEKVVKYNAANREVAILCNHQRTKPKSHDMGVQRISDNIREMFWQKLRLKRMILELDKSLKKTKPYYFEELDDLSVEEEQAIQDRVIAKEREKVTKKFARDNEKLKTEDSPLLPEAMLEEKLQKIDELAAEYKKELKTRKPEIKSVTVTVEKLESQVEKLEQRIRNATLLLQDKEDNSQVALGTSKLNYIDPRLTVMFSKKYDVPIEKLFSKTLREKFAWAIESADENWTF